MCVSGGFSAIKSCVLSGFGECGAAVERLCVENITGVDDPLVVVIVVVIDTNKFFQALINHLIAYYAEYIRK